MADRGIDDIPEREREVLRLLVRGHDAKSSARALDLSIHVVNERLRDSRRRLGVSSSREAARILAAHEGADFLGDKEIGLRMAERRRILTSATGARRATQPLMIGAAIGEGAAHLAHLICANAVLLHQAPCRISSIRRQFPIRVRCIVRVRSRIGMSLDQERIRQRLQLSREKTKQLLPALT